MEEAPVSKAIKQEKTTPAKSANEALRRSTRRSPSPARVPPTREKTTRKSPSPTASTCRTAKNRKVIVDDSDEDLNLNTERKATSKGTEDKLVRKSPSPCRTTTSKSKNIIVDDSDDDLNLDSERNGKSEKRSSETRSNEAESFWDLGTETRRPPPRSKRRKLDHDLSDEEEVVTKKGRGGKTRHDVSDDDVKKGRDANKMHELHVCDDDEVLPSRRKVDSGGRRKEWEKSDNDDWSRTKQGANKSEDGDGTDDLFEVKRGGKDSERNAREAKTNVKGRHEDSSHGSGLTRSPDKTGNVRIKTEVCLYDFCPVILAMS